MLYGVYISQLIRYSRACISYHDFLDRGLLLTRKLLNQEFQMVKLKSSLRKFYGRHHELVDRYGITVSQMISDMFITSFIIPFPFMNVTYRIRLYRICYHISNTTGATCGAGSAYPSGAPEITPSFWWGSCCLFFSFLCCVVCTIVFLFVFFIFIYGVVSLF